MRNYIRSQLKASSVTSDSTSMKYFSPRYNQKIYGKVEMGETIMVEYDGEKTVGKVFYIHPQRRFFSIVSNKGVTESFYFPQAPAKEE